MSKTDCMHIASSFSGIIEVAVSHPLDRIKTEIQIMTLNNSKSNVLTGIKHIYQNNGFKGFYSGIYRYCSNEINVLVINDYCF